ncbi:uncharacterized protein DFL_003855 [Arthrobotrys flagrans]|uniref:Uncharacterized protein n=1 Tax=Arthrobotrys flagrans TaxID=97331 RepID=A0A437A369_ARTFL|nr:hypothetical protein DFL_003855 [Arthrobotrys flagrans]
MSKFLSYQIDQKAQKSEVLASMTFETSSLEPPPRVQDNSDTGNRAPLTFDRQTRLDASPLRPNTVTKLIPTATQHKELQH